MPCPTLRFLPLRLRRASLLALMLASGAVQAQNLNELYEAARAYDATYLSARALADSAQYRAAQADALLRPSAALTGSATLAEINTVVGNTVGEAFNWMHRLELSCQTQLAAMACNTPLAKVPQPVLDETWNNYQPGTRRPYGVMEWPALLRKLDRMDPGYRE